MHYGSVVERNRVAKEVGRHNVRIEGHDPYMCKLIGSSDDCMIGERICIHVVEVVGSCAGVLRCRPDLSRMDVGFHEGCVEGCTRWGLGE